MPALMDGLNGMAPEEGAVPSGADVASGGGAVGRESPPTKDWLDGEESNRHDQAHATSDGVALDGKFSPIATPRVDSDPATAAAGRLTQSNIDRQQQQQQQYEREQYSQDQQQRSPTPDAVILHGSAVESYMATHSFTASKPEQISFRNGDL